MFSSGRIPSATRRSTSGCRRWAPASTSGAASWRGQAPARDDAGRRHDRELEQQAGGRLAGRGRQLVLRLGAPQRAAGAHASTRPQTHTLASTVGAMNYAATQDLRTAQALPRRAAVLETGPAPSARAQQMFELLEDWRAQGSSRLDADLNGTIDHPGAAIMDKAWPKFADAVMGPVLGPQLDDLAILMGRDNAANNQGSAYGSGWYGYVEKDLRHVLGPPGRRAVQDAVLRQRGPGDVPRLAVGGARAGGGRARGRAGQPEPGRLARRRRGREDLLLARLPVHHDALDQPAHVPAGHQLLGPPLGLAHERRASGPGASARAAPPRPARLTLRPRDTARAMSQENVELIRGAFDAFNRRRLGDVRHVLDHDVKFVSRLGAVEGDYSAAHEAYPAPLGQPFGVWPDFTAETSRSPTRWDDQRSVAALGVFASTTVSRGATSRGAGRSGTIR